MDERWEKCGFGGCSKVVVVVGGVIVRVERWILGDGGRNEGEIMGRK